MTGFFCSASWFQGYHCAARITTSFLCMAERYRRSTLVYLLIHPWPHELLPPFSCYEHHSLLNTSSFNFIFASSLWLYKYLSFETFSLLSVHDCKISLSSVIIIESQIFLLIIDILDYFTLLFFFICEEFLLISVNELLFSLIFFPFIFLIST